MKLRCGFVSNSSTSSFLVVGWEVDRDQLSRVQIFEAILPEEVLNEKSQHIYKKNWDDLSPDDRSNVCYYLDEDLVVMDDEEQGAPYGKTIIGCSVGGDFEEGFSVRVDELMQRVQNISISGMPDDVDGKLGRSPILGLHPDSLKLIGGTCLS